MRTRWFGLGLLVGFAILSAIGLASLGAEEEEEDETSATDVLISQLTVESESILGVSYDRDDYMPNGWQSVHERCDVREIVLLTEAVLIAGVDSGCQPRSGAWYSWFDGEKVYRSSQIDIDHLVPLAEAHRSGAAEWSDERKLAYANDLDLEAALAAVSRSSNRSKADSDPASWKPPLRSSWCQYAHDWIAVKAKWELSADSEEVEALRAMLDTCEDAFERLDEHPERVDFIFGALTTSDQEDPADGGASVEPATETATTPQVVTYDSCEQAEEAGIERQRGSKGNGRGFPAHLVPSARDGDGDGVVCER